MSEYYNVVPWYKSKEWHKTYKDIFSPSATNLTKKDALELLHVWKARRPNLPSGIESTLTLLEVHMQDIKNIEVVGEHIIRLAYSTALMRFVNHMLDLQTEKGSSLYKAALNLGIPDWMIDLRHDTAHGNSLPSIELLREATSIALDWLKVNYWDKHKELVKDYVCGEMDPEVHEDSKVEVLMNFCFSLSICAHSKLNIKSLADIPDKKMIKSMMNDIQVLFGDSIDLSNLNKVTIRSLINFINIHSKRLLKTKNTALHVNKALLGNDSLFLSLDLLNFLSECNTRTDSFLRKPYVHSFEVLLTYLHTNDLLQNFLLELIRITQCCDENSQKRKLAALWTSEILKALKKSSQFVKKFNKIPSKNMEKKTKSELKSLFYHWFPNEKGYGLLLDLFKPIPEDFTDINFVRPIISTYNVYLTYFIKDILNVIEPPLPETIIKNICKLSTLIASPMKQFQKKVPAKVFTVDDVRAATEEQFTIDVEEHADSEIDCDPETDTSRSDLQTHNKEIICGIWKIVPSAHDWSKCPIGAVPWEVDGSLQETESTEDDCESMEIDMYQ